MWTVTRQSGRRRDPIRTLYSGEDEAKARDTYTVQKIKMRQGLVELMRDGERVEAVNAPRLRSRW